MGTACLEVHSFENYKETLEVWPFSVPLHTGCKVFAGVWSRSSLLEQSPEPLIPSFCSWREPEGGLQHRLFTLSCCIYSCFVSHSSRGKSKGQLVTAETNGGSGKDTGCSYLEEILNKHHHQEPFYLPRSIKTVTYSNCEKLQNYFCVLCLPYRHF